MSLMVIKSFPELISCHRNFSHGTLSVLPIHNIRQVETAIILCVRWFKMARLQLYCLGASDIWMISRGDWGKAYCVSLPSNGDLKTWFLGQPDGNPRASDSFPSLSEQVLNFPSQSTHHAVGSARCERALQTEDLTSKDISDYMTDDLHDVSLNKQSSPHDGQVKSLFPSQPIDLPVGSASSERENQTQSMTEGRISEYHKSTHIITFIRTQTRTKSRSFCDRVFDLWSTNTNVCKRVDM